MGHSLRVPGRHWARVQVGLAVFVALVVSLVGPSVMTALGTESQPFEFCSATGSTGVSGTVTETGSGAPLSGAWVAVLRTSDFSIAGGGFANGNGDYTADVPAGSYYLYVVDPAGHHTAGFFGPPTTVTVNPGAFTDADPQVAPTLGAATGTVTEAGTGDPIAGAFVLALSAATGVPETGTIADVTGHYTLGGLRPGDHLMVFVDPAAAHTTLFYGGASDANSSTRVAITAGAFTAADQALPTQPANPGGATIAGTVTETATGDPLPGVAAMALNAADYRFARATLTDANGDYSLDLAPGDYKQVFFDTTGTHHLEWHDGHPYYGLADADSVTAPAVTDTTLDPNSGNLAGTIVDDPSGEPLGCVWVIAIGPTGLTGTTTNPDGTYTIEGLAPGTYRATIVDPVGGRLQEYFDDSPDSIGATPFNITEANTTTIDAAIGRPLSEPPQFVQEWGEHAIGPGEFNRPQGVAINQVNGDLYVTDSFGSKVVRFSASGAFVSEWGSYGPGPGEFYIPEEVAVDPARDAVYVTGDDRVQKFTLAGEYVTQWGEYGTGNAQFSNSTGIGVDSSGNVYVADSSNNRVQKFSSTGSFLTSWGSEGSGNGQFYSIDDLALDASDNVYVAGGSRIQKFSSTGTYLTQWGSFGSADGEFQNQTHLSVNQSTGDVYVSDPGFDIFGNPSAEYRVQRFTSAGAFVSKWGSYGSGPGQFRDNAGVAIRPSGEVVVVDTGNRRLQQFTSSGDFEADLARTIFGDGEFYHTSDVAFSGLGSGHLYAIDNIANQVQEFTTDGDFVRRWGTLGSGDGQFDDPQQLAANQSTGAIYITDRNNNRVQQFSSAGVFSAAWGVYGSDPGQFIQPTGIAVSPLSGDVYVVDGGFDYSTFTNAAYRVQRFTAEGVFVSQWGSTGSAAGQFEDPFGIAVSPLTGDVYVTDGGNDRVQRFTDEGVFVSQWGSEGSGPGQFYSTGDVAVDPVVGDVYVTGVSGYNGECRVQKFSANGTFLAEWGQPGQASGEFDEPLGLTVADDQDIYIADTFNQRIQRFTPP